jgi:hypothetical protein
VTEDEHVEHAAYHDQLVRAEVLLHRVMRAKARGIPPVNLHLRDDAEQRCLQRPRPGSCAGDSAEWVRWIDRDGYRRARPLNREQLTQELMEQQGASLLRAIDRASSESHALPGEDQAWLEERARLPALERPLNGCEYLALVRAIEAAYVPPRGKSGNCAPNVQIALRMARRLGGLHVDYTPSPFRIEALSMAYKAGHHDYLARRAAYVCATEARLRFSQAKPRVKIDAKVARQRAEHAALLASRALAAATARGEQAALPDAAAIAHETARRVPPFAAAAGTPRITLA